MKLGVFLILILSSSFLFGQKEIDLDSIPKTKKHEKDSIKKHSPTKAAIFSAVLPGAGQVYNSIARPRPKHAYWKVPLIYAGLGATGYFMVTNHLKQVSIKKEYRFRESTNFTQKGDNEWNLYDESSLIQLHQKYLNQRDWFILGMGLVYLLQVADAAVEAHFVKFDISEDLTLQIRPTMIIPEYNRYNYGNQPSLGIKLALNFK